MSAKQWCVVAAQLDLLDNNPVLRLVCAKTANVMSLAASQGLSDEIGLSKEDIWCVGYLAGVSDRHFLDLEKCAEKFRVALGEIDTFASMVNCSF